MKKHIVCYGDSNTHGYCADPADCADGILCEADGARFNEEERYPCLLQKELGENYLILEEGLSGRTSLYEDPLTEGLNGLTALRGVLMSHAPVDLLIIMLGTNDTKDRFAVNAGNIAEGYGRLFKKAFETPCWGKGGPKVLYVCPPAIRDAVLTSACAEHMGSGCIEKSRLLASRIQPVCEANHVAFLDAAECEFNDVDGMHLTKKGHAQLASLLAHEVSRLL